MLKINAAFFFFLYNFKFSIFSCSDYCRCTGHIKEESKLNNYQLRETIETLLPTELHDSKIIFSSSFLFRYREKDFILTRSVNKDFI